MWICDKAVLGLDNIARPFSNSRVLRHFMTQRIGQEKLVRGARPVSLLRGKS
jgi:hypothetical protein